MKHFKFIILLMIFLLISTSKLQAEPETYMRKLALITDIGLGNLISVYGAYSLLKNHNIGLGCGYLYYSDPDTEVKINAIEPSIIWFTTIADMFMIRTRAGINLIGRNGEALKTTAYVIAPDFLVNVVNYKSSIIYAGVSLPFVIGKESVEMDTVIGAGYGLNFNMGVSAKGEREKTIKELIKKSTDAKREKAEELYFFGLDSYYKGDIKGAIKYWKKIKTTDKELKRRINQQIKDAKESLKED